jgi:hypothetical protein
MPSTPLIVMYFLIILHRFNTAFTVQDCKHEKENHIGNKFPYLLKYSCDQKNYQCCACLHNVHGLVFVRSAKDIVEITKAHLHLVSAFTYHTHGMMKENFFQ